MRQIVLDTETTGLESDLGHRIIEIGCVEIVNRRLTGRRYHQYLQPDREIDSGAKEVHGIDEEFLADKPRFGDVVEDFLLFIDDAELVIHNAPFDVGFLNAELKLAKKKDLNQYCFSVTDTLDMARKLHPGQKNNLDALCRRYEVDNSQRDLHGALLDAEILADVYLAMTGGQGMLQFTDKDVQRNQGKNNIYQKQTRIELPVIRATDTELLEHNQYLQLIEKASGQCLWLKEEENACG